MIFAQLPPRTLRSTRYALAILCCGLLACDPIKDHDPLVDGGGVDTGIVGLPCPTPPPDTDGDGISDEYEGASESPPRDTDLDGIPDFRDADSDGDGIPDAIEARNGNACTPPADSDNDGKPDFRDLDSDDATDSTLPDRIEAGPMPTQPLDTNHDGKPDYMDPDDDGDGIPDVLELTAQGGTKAAQVLADAPDTDGDGTPDYLDLDSDNDNISDKDERFADVDGDLIPNYRDDDADGDCVGDRFEAGDDSLSTPPVDTDGDGTPDYLDKDSDNDGLLDGQEDKNCSGTVDACETSRIVADTDGDGVSDLVEYEACAVETPAVQMQTMCACDGTDPNTTPQTHGDFVFVVDYQKPPTPMVEVLSFSTDVNQADIVFAIDTTGSMQNCINNLKNGLSSLVTTVKARVPDSAFGVFEFRDLGFPQNDPSTTPPNLPSFRYAQRVETVAGAGLADVQAALVGLAANGGGDGPEAGWAALFTLASQTTRVINVLSSTTYSLATNPGILALSTGETGGLAGGAGFRVGSVPIVVTVSDAEWHDAPGSLMGADAESGLNMYPSSSGPPFFTTACDPCTNVPSRREAITALQAVGAHLIGLAAIGSSTTGDPKTRAMKAALETGAIVSPADFGPVGTRPLGCPIDQCCTGLDGSDNVVGEAAQAGQCPLSFKVDDNNGKGVSDSVAAGITALASALHFDVHVEASDVDPNTVDNFLLSLTPDVSGVGAAMLCVIVPPSPLADNFTGPKALNGSDGKVDTFPGLHGGLKVCFDVMPKMNTTVPGTSSPQLFRAQLQVKGVSGTNSVNLGTPRQVFFLVPPVIVNPPIN